MQIHKTASNGLLGEYGEIKWMAVSHPFFCVKINLKSKKDSLSNKSVFLGEGIFTMGLVKTIYNVLGGFYICYDSIIFTESVHKL